MKYRRIAAFALGMLLILSSGCGASNSSPSPTKTESDKSTTIIEYKDTKVSKDEITKRMNKYATSQGMSIEDLKAGDESEIWDRFKNDIVQEIAVDHMALEKATELGLDKLTDEEKANLDEAYQTSLSKIESTVEASVKADMVSDSTLDHDTEYKKQLDDYFYLQGYSVDTYRQDLENEYIISKVKDYYTKDVSVSDDDVKAYYDSNLELQKNNIDISPESVEQQQSLGSTVLYYPEGYKRIRHLLIGFDSATSGSAAVAYYNNDPLKYKKMVEEAMPTIQPKVDEVIAKLEAGEDFTKLIDDYNDDTTVDEEPYRTKGFIEGPYSTNIDLPGYIDALSSLTEAGQYTTVSNFYGCYIIHCEEIMEGAVPYDEVKDDIKTGLDKQKKDLTWSTTTQGWVDEAKAAGTLKLYADQY